jgi:hypothetical protein
MRIFYLINNNQNNLLLLIKDIFNLKYNSIYKFLQISFPK